MGVPQELVGLYWKLILKIDDLGLPIFWKTSLWRQRWGPSHRMLHSLLLSGKCPPVLCRIGRRGVEALLGVEGRGTRWPSE